MSEAQGATAGARLEPSLVHIGEAFRPKAGPKTQVRATRKFTSSFKKDAVGKGCISWFSQPPYLIGEVLWYDNVRHVLHKCGYIEGLYGRVTSTPVRKDVYDEVLWNRRVTLANEELIEKETTKEGLFDFTLQNFRKPGSTPEDKEIKSCLVTERERCWVKLKEPSSITWKSWSSVSALGPRRNGTLVVVTRACYHRVYCPHSDLDPLSTSADTTTDTTASNTGNTSGAGARRTDYVEPAVQSHSQPGRLVFSSRLQLKRIGEDKSALLLESKPPLWRSLFPIRKAKTPSALPGDYDPDKQGRDTGMQSPELEAASREGLKRQLSLTSMYKAEILLPPDDLTDKIVSERQRGTYKPEHIHLVLLAGTISECYSVLGTGIIEDEHRGLIRAVFQSNIELVGKFPTDAGSLSSCEDPYGLYVAWFHTSDRDTHLYAWEWRHKFLFEQLPQELVASSFHASAMGLNQISSLADMALFSRSTPLQAFCKDMFNLASLGMFDSQYCIRLFKLLIGCMNFTPLTFDTFEQKVAEEFVRHVTVLCSCNGIKGFLDEGKGYTDVESLMRLLRSKAVCKTTKLEEVNSVQSMVQLAMRPPPDVEMSKVGGFVVALLRLRDKLRLDDKRCLELFRNQLPCLAASNES